MNEKFLIGLKKTHEIEQEILKITDFPLHNTINPCSYNEKISLLDQLYEETAKMINDLNILILEMRKNLEIKDEIRGIWEIKIENLDFKSKTLMKELRKGFKLKKEAFYEEKEKSELLGAQYSFNSNNNVSILIKEQESIKNSLINTSEMVSLGRNIINSLKFQGDSLKNIQKKVYTLLNEVGLSNTMTKLIERRSRNDMYILFITSILLIIVIIILYFYIRPLIKS